MNRIFSSAAVIATLFIFDAFVLTKSADAQVKCKHDMFGNYVCKDSYGNRSSTKKDMFGNDVTRFNDGRTMKCKHDMFGNYVCR